MDHCEIIRKKWNSQNHFNTSRSKNSFFCFKIIFRKCSLWTFAFHHKATMKNVLVREFSATVAVLGNKSTATPFPPLDQINPISSPWVALSDQQQGQS